MLLVLSRPVAGQEAAYNEWYDSVHLPEVRELDGFDTAVRYRLAREQLPGRVLPSQTYLSVYGISADVGTALTSLDRAVTSGSILFPPSLDRAAVRSWAYERHRG